MRDDHPEFTTHLEFEKEAAAIAFLEAKKAEGLRGSIHKIMVGKECQPYEIDAIRYVWGTGEREIIYHMRRDEAGWFVCLWDKNINASFHDAMNEKRKYGGKI